MYESKIEDDPKTRQASRRMQNRQSQLPEKRSRPSHQLNLPKSKKKKRQGKKELNEIPGAKKAKQQTRESKRQAPTRRPSESWNKSAKNNMIRVQQLSSSQEEGMQAPNNLRARQKDHQKEVEISKQNMRHELALQEERENPKASRTLGTLAVQLTTNLWSKKFIRKVVLALFRDS